MKKNSMLLLLIAVIALVGCQNKSKSEVPQNGAAKPLNIPAGTGKKGTVSKTMNQGGYTYIEVDDKGEKTWLALPEMKVAEGDKIEYQETQPMVNFTSKTLHKTFSKIYFVKGVKIAK